MAFISGGPRAAASGETFHTHNPADNSVLAAVARDGDEEVDAAVAAAAGAFDAWRSTTARERGRLLLRLATLVRDHTDEVSGIESRNAGKPISSARGEIGLVADCFEYYGGAATKLAGTTPPVAAAGLAVTLREPIGVVAAIVPWNFPLVLASWKLGPALAAGNTVVAKPASLTPLSLLRLAELAVEAGLPPGVLNVVTGPGTTVGRTLASHPGVGKVSFTGETATGAEIMALAAADIKRVTLELGGKSPNVVFADADLEAAATQSVWSVFDNAGQDCCARSRLLVQEDVAEEVVERFVAAAEAIRVGDPADEATEMGPLISPAQRDTVWDYVQSGLADGARVASGAELRGPGNYLTPTVLTGVRPDMRVAREEIFGPVCTVLTFRTEEDAVALANDSVFGLSASLWTRDVGRAIRVARAMRTGVISVNSNQSVHIEAPFGGYKRSGLGRELGMDAFAHYTETKTVFFSER